ncbi:hypothetical protein ACHHYP_13104 [Achlya hypogyna]|uniref:Uncharacterized protein n=1 Tax=Achlya hypogyna TaxID=1202772 RepID=A0A1V9YFX8_ACHHY|nr:hypothetical protein ACHHYP_13104 [Achlya hypogyna]
MGSAPSTSNQKGIVRLARDDCTGSVQYTNVLSTLPDGSTLSGCTDGYVGNRDLISAHYAPDTQYATITIPDMGSSEEIIDLLCVPVSPMNDIFLMASCASQDFAYYTDANCSQVLPFQASSVSFTCATPNPLSWPSTSSQVGQTFEQANCTGKALYALNVGTGGIPYDVLLPHAAATISCAQGVVYNKTIFASSFGLNDTYMTIARSYMTEVGLDGACVFTGDKYLQPKCADQTYAYYSDAACTQSITFTEVGPVAAKCSVLFTNTTAAPPTTIVIKSGSGSAIGLMLFCVLVGNLLFGYIVSRPRAPKPDSAKVQLKSGKMPKSDEDIEDP